MFKKQLPIATLIALVSMMWTTSALAQVIENNMPSRSTAIARGSMMCRGTANAGATLRTLGQNNKNRTDIRYLCLGDSLFLTPNGAPSLAEDPIANTIAGIGYLIYNCPPTISGPRASDVRNDNCWARNPANGFRVSTRGDVTGRDTFFNDGGIQRFFNGGRPHKLYFAPATFYDFYSPVEDYFEGDTACVHVNVADNQPDSFSVVYLNAVRVTNVISGTLAGSFTVSGGLPEFDPSATYASFSIVLASNPTIQGTITSTNVRNGGTVNFTVPQNGTYIITARDGKSCDGAATAIFPSVTVQVSRDTVNFGETSCLKVTVQNFTNITGAQLYFQYDTSILQFVGLQSPNLPSLTPADINRIPNSNLLVLTWFNATPVTRADGATIFELCFRAIGPLGSISPVSIKDTLQGLEILNDVGRTLGINRFDGSVRIARPVTLSVGCSTVAPNDTICIPIRTRGFTTIGSMQFTLVFDPSVLRFIPPARNVNLPADFNINNPVIHPNIIVVSWNPPSGSVTRTDNSTLFELCFKAIGPLGASSAIRIVDTLGNQIDIADQNLRSTSIQPIIENCSVNVLNTDFTLKVLTDSARCNGDRGGFRAIPTGAGEPFTYTWRSATNPGINGNGTILLSGDTLRVSNLAIGKYYITVTNALGTKVKIDSVTIVQPNPLFLNPPTFVNPSCFDATDGSLTLVNFGGGTAPYTFLWNTGSTATAISNLAAGAYGVTMTDARGCKDSIPRFTIGVNEIVISNTNVIDATCVGVNTGSITIGSVQGGTPNASGNYTFRWSNGTTTTGAAAALTNLAAGTYLLTVSDSRSCEKRLTFTVGVTRALESNAVVGNISCYGQLNGFINVIASARGTESRPYVFSWTGAVGTPSNTPTSSTVTRLAAGTYPLSIRDNAGCRLDTFFNITQPDSLRITTTDLKNESCIGGPNNGSITLSTTGGTPRTAGLPYSYQWNRSPQDTLPVIAGLSAGSYTVTVTDANNCQKIQTFTVSAPVLPILDSIQVRAATCSDRNDGFARLFVRAGTGLRIDSIRWSNTGFLDSITAVVPGTYTVRTFSSNGCQRLDTVRIPSPPPLSINRARSSKTDPVCPKDPTGTIILVMQGGTGPYDYRWSGGPNTSNAVFSSLAAGTYNFTITDSRGCTPVIDSVTIIDPPSIKATYSDLEAVSCYGACRQSGSDGKATVTASGGTANTGTFSFTWATGEACNAGNQCRAILLCGGWQRVSITDNICGIIDSVFIPQPEPFTFDPPIYSPPTCHGDRDGSIEVRVKGGNPAYSYFWSNGTTQNRISNIPAGSYALTVTDSKLCSYPTTLNLTQPDSMRIDTVADGTNDVTCYGLADGQIKLKRSGGNGGQTIWTWGNNIATSDSVANLRAGVYNITATDVKNCTTSVSINLTQPDPIYFFMQPPTPPRCNGDLTTIRVDTAFGSTYRHPFTVSVDNGPQYPIGYFVPVFAGPHQVQVIEQVTGCLLDTTIIVNEPPAIKLSFDPAPPPNQITKVLVGLGDSLRLTPNITSALPIDSVSWTPRTYLSFRNDPLRPFVRPLDDVTYKLRVFDVNGCAAEAEILVELDRNRNIFVPNIFSPNADDRNDYFGVFSGAGVKSINFIRIYDRWGELLFQKTGIKQSMDISEGWDGTHRGRPVANGVYIYMIEVEFEDGQKLLYRGDVTLVR